MVNLYVGTLGVLMPSLSLRFGWSRAQLSASVLIVCAGLLLFGPAVAPLIARVGLRAVALRGAVDVVCGVDDGCARQSGRQQHGLDHRRHQALSTQSRVSTIDSTIRRGPGQLYCAAARLVDSRLFRVAGRLFFDSDRKPVFDRSESVGSFSATQ
jgi:hypothetical protein